MKKIIFGFISLFLLFIGTNAFADRIVITGNPVLLSSPVDDVYTVDEDWSPSGYVYVTVPSNDVCYSTVQKQFTVTPSTYKFKIKEKVQSVYCYPATAEYFTISP